MITDPATLKDDAMVVMARLDRIDATVQSLVVEVPPCTAAMSGWREQVERVRRGEEEARPAGALPRILDRPCEPCS